MVQASRGCSKLFKFFSLSLKLIAIKWNPSCNVINNQQGNKNNQKLNFYIMGVKKYEGFSR